jgi:hypothetical protein
MSRRSLVLGTCLSAFVVAGCQEQATSPVAASPSPRFSPSAAAALQQSGIQNLVSRRAPLVLPASVVARDKVFGDAGRPAIDPTDYVCSQGSPVVNVVNAELARTFSTAGEAAKFFTIYNVYGDLVPTYDALYFGDASTPQTYGYNGEFTKQITKTERDIKLFWDIQSSDIQVLAMHGTVLLDVARTARTLELFGYTPAQALAYAQAIRQALLTSTTMNGGNYGFFTFNAYAFSDFAGPIPDKIVMGDGILDAYAKVGLGDVAPQGIFAHEFAHHIQYENEYFDDLDHLSAPEQTRYTELMADAMAAYYLTHARGAALNQKRVVQFLEVFYQIGDCAFADPGHHGTPNQRMAAAEFGFQVAADFQKQGHILTAEEFYQLFVAAYPSLIAPDAP